MSVFLYPHTCGQGLLNHICTKKVTSCFLCASFCINVNFFLIQFQEWFKLKQAIKGHLVSCWNWPANLFMVRHLYSSTTLMCGQIKRWGSSHQLNDHSQELFHHCSHWWPPEIAQAQFLIHALVTSCADDRNVTLTLVPVKAQLICLGHLFQQKLTIFHKTFWFYFIFRIIIFVYCNASLGVSKITGNEVIIMLELVGVSFQHH